MRTLFFLFIVSIVACKSNQHHEPNKIERSFYYWKSIFKLSNKEKIALETLKVNTLYLKFFDVVWDSKTYKAFPIAQIDIKDTAYLHKNIHTIIPTIFITNESILKIDSATINQLANNIFTLAQSITTKNTLANINEIQVDCDWTAKTKSKYFALLTKLQSLDTSITISATIRLHQIKYASNTGVPPVKKGMLMCYNMGNLTNVNSTNSILEIDELKKYIGNLNHYALPLDVALPLFDWKVHYRKNVFKGLIQDLPEQALNSSAFSKTDNKYKAIKDTLVNGYDFKKDDILRIEETKFEEIIKAAALLKQKLKNKNIQLSLYHLDTVTLKKFTTHEMENIFNSMR